ncbi:hypothetical protein EUA06_21070 [Nocardioides glacieisoli]|uniref:DUF222 domain-containing protein n=1 Tax=Nocardioides glacieisoli TaxID=1168730 RepID=A0A4Q2RLM5_9ACTN|nr:hypothetical protein [Nocardioides glacieisoli]RYB88489.1 hypothetical protein EUA06_21070 [Nocardioides glacieisoli]
MNSDLLDLDAKALLAAATEAERASRLAEVAKLELLSAWAAIHSTDPTEGPDGYIARRVGNVLRQVGGDGTPGVQDFCLGEIALARGAGVTATSNMLADVLDLEHRLPLTWAVTRRGECEVWLARKVAKLSRHLPADRVHVVDTAVSRMIASEAPGRVLQVAEAKVIEADPALHEERCEAERRRRYIGLGRTDEYGLRTLIAKLEAGDAVAVDATVHRVADIIEPLHPDASPDELRAIAFGWLARPAELFMLLLEHTDSEPDVEPEPDSYSEPDPDLGPDDDCKESSMPARAYAFPADLLDALRDIDLTPLAPKVVLHVHLHEAALHGTDAVARVEGLGPVSLARLMEMLRGSVVRVQPVKDLSHRVRYTAYEHPESLRDQVHLVTGGDYWPWATSTSRSVDLDHPIPYDHGAPNDGRDPPPGQTGSHNSGPLGRRHHRWKTHAGYTARQCGEGRYVLLSPHGLAFLIDHTGTHPVHPEKARMIIDAPAGVDIYPA